MIDNNEYRKSAELSWNSITRAGGGDLLTLLRGFKWDRTRYIDTYVTSMESR